MGGSSPDGRRRSRAFWVIPCQPMQVMYGAQGENPDPVAGQVLIALIAGMSMNDGFAGLPAFHVSISQREIAKRTGLSRKVVCNALERLEGRGHLTPIKVPSDGTRRGPNSRMVYLIDVLADKATAFHERGTSAGTSAGTEGSRKGTSNIQTEVSDGEQRELLTSDSPPKTHPKETTRDTYSEDFETFWSTYPKAKNDNKREAWAKWQACLKEGYSADVMIAGGERYAHRVEVEGIEPRYRKHAKTFLGPGLHFLDAHEPEDEPMSGMGFDDDDFE